MAATIDIGVAVDRQEFDALKAKFDQYAAALGKMPAAWWNVGSEAAKTKTSFEITAASVEAGMPS